MVNNGLPPPPPAVIALRSLGDRLGQVCEWYDKEVATAFWYRSSAYNQAQIITDLDVRIDVRNKIYKRHEARLFELDVALKEFKTAYRNVRQDLNYKEISRYTEKVRPIIDKRDKLEQKQRQAERMAEATRKSERFKAVTERREAREKRRDERILARIGKKDG